VGIGGSGVAVGGTGVGSTVAVGSGIAVGSGDAVGPGVAVGGTDVDVGSAICGVCVGCTTVALVGAAQLTATTLATSKIVDNQSLLTNIINLLSIFNIIIFLITQKSRRFSILFGEKSTRVLRDLPDLPMSDSISATYKILSTFDFRLITTEE